MDSGANIFISQNRLSDLIDQITRCDKETADGDKNREASTFARSLLTRPVLSESDAFQVSPLLPIQSMEVPRNGYSHLIKQMIKVQESMGTGNEGSWRAVGWSVGLCEFFKGPMKLGNDPFLAKGTNFLSTAVEVCGTALQEGWRRLGTCQGF